MSKRSTPKGGQATSSAATGANALFYTDVRRKGKKRQKAEIFNHKGMKEHEGNLNSELMNYYGEIWIREIGLTGLELRYAPVQDDSITVRGKMRSSI